MKSTISLPLTPRLATTVIKVAFFNLFAAIILSCTGLSAGTVDGDDWLPVNSADLELKAPLVDPNADAEAIFWDIRIDDGGDNDLVLSNYIRIKIFNERGREQQSKIKIAFFSGTKVKDIAARTIRPDGSISELTKADIIENIVVNVRGFKLRTKTFALPGTQPGSIIEYKWKEVISNASANFLRLNFQREIPIQSITYRIKPQDSGPFYIRPFNMTKPRFQKEENGFYVTTVTKMPAFREEPLMPPGENVKAWSMVRYYNLFSSLADYFSLATQVYLGSEQYMKVGDEIKRKSLELTAGATTAEEKLARIFTFCRTQIRNIDSKNSGFTEEEIKKLKENKTPNDTLKRGVGSGGDINLLFGALANASGLYARIALLPDRGKWLLDRNEFVPGVLRPANIAVKVGTTWKFFDPGLQYITPGMLRWQEEGVDALIADENATWVKTPMSQPEKSREKRSATLQLDENGTLEGDVSIEYTGHLAVERKVLNEDDSPSKREENLKEAVKSRLSTAEVTNIVIENATDPIKPFIYKYHVRVPQYAERTGKRLFLRPGYFHKGIAALFTAGTRQYPIYFNFPWSEEDKVTIKLPKGFVLDNADRPSPITAGEICRYEVNMGVTKDQTTLVYNRTFFFGGREAILFPVENYEQIKRLFDEINRADNHAITLKETTPN